MEYRNIRIEHDAALTYIVLNRPDKINALSGELIAEMSHALKTISQRRGSRVIIIRGEGRHFCAGHDLKELVDRDTADYRMIFEACIRMMTLLQNIPQPVIAQTHGIATAAGCQLVAACDLAVAEEGASFGTPGVTIGLFCSTPAVPLVRAIGRKRALEMLLTGRVISAAQALEWGLINQVVPPGELAETARRLALDIASASPLTVAIGKKTFYEQLEITEERAYGVAKNVMSMNLTTWDAQEGIHAFLEKRKPVWQGK